MKRTLNRSILTFILAAAFLVGLSVLAFRLVTQCEDWVQQPFNGHTSGSNGLAQAGSIYDRNKTVLAHTADGERVYHEDHSTRCALLHVVGDNSLNISTAVQSIYRTELTGYSFIWGMGLPDSLKTSHDIDLTIDADTCRAVYEEFDGRKGACVVYNYKTGEILCSVSSYSYDPQAPPEITEENESEYDGVYLNHVLSSSYAPGSTFKIVTSAAAIENISDINERTFHCSGEKEIGGSKVTCLASHGDISFYNAMAYSCNIAYAELAVELGKEKMTKTATNLGFNESFDVDGNPTAKTNYNVSQANENQLAWSGVGQYTNLANPMQMAILCGAIANEGVPVKPYVVNRSSALFKAIGIDQTQGEYTRMMSAETAGALKDIMRYTVSDYYGDGMFDGLTVCAKTGTAEVGEDKDPNAWIVGFSTDEEAPLAFAVVVENGGYGSSAAGPIAVTAMTKAAVAINNQE